jgi:hypothetical protein
MGATAVLDMIAAAPPIKKSFENLSYSADFTIFLSIPERCKKITIE